MKFKKIIMSAMLLAGCLTASAQQQAATKEAFNPHWFVQAQMGGQYTLGEVSFGDLLSGNAQVAAGYKFSRVWALRLAIGGWQSKGGSDLSFMTTENLGVETSPVTSPTGFLATTRSASPMQASLQVSVPTSVGTTKRPQPCNRGFSRVQHQTRHTT